MSDTEPAIEPSTLPSLPTTTHPITTPHCINIGTRRSKLAKVQTQIVVDLLKQKWPHHEYRVHAISTMGDKNQITALHDFGAKSLWTHELEAMLLDGQVDFIVHSLKDIPTHLPPSCNLGAILPREDPRDALILSPHLLPPHAPTIPTLSSLPQGSIIGTSSVRRSAQLKRLYPQLDFKSVRGNVGTRLSKLDKEGSEYAALILAAAGLIRVDEGHRISGFLESRNVEGEGAEAAHAIGAHSDVSARLPGTDGANLAKADMGAEAKEVERRQAKMGDRKWGMLHAVGQGALGIEIREGDERVEELLEPLRCRRTTLACLAERSLMRTLEGGCSVPIGVETEWREGDGDNLVMRAIVVSLDGAEAAEAEETKVVSDAVAADDFGREIALLLSQRGADKILASINLDRDVIEKQEGGA